MLGYHYELCKMCGNDLIEKTVSKFNPDEEVYYVYKGKFGRINIVKTEINTIAYTNIWNYHIWVGDGFWSNICVQDCSPVFKTKDEAYKYAETLERRKHIKYYDIGR